MKDLLQGTKEERARFTYQCIQGIVCNSDSNPVDVLEDITKIIDLYQKTKDYTMNNTVYTLSVQKIKNMLPFEYGDLCMFINPFEVQDWNNVNVIEEFVPVCDREQDYDLGRIKYFLEHPDEIDCIDLEYDGDILIINDGNHRFIAACILNHSTINATFCGVLNYPDGSSVVDSLKGEDNMEENKPNKEEQRLQKCIDFAAKYGTFNSEQSAEDFKKYVSEHIKFNIKEKEKNNV